MCEVKKESEHSKGKRLTKKEKPTASTWQRCPFKGWCALVNVLVSSYLCRPPRHAEKSRERERKRKKRIETTNKQRDTSFKRQVKKPKQGKRERKRNKENQIKPSAAFACFWLLPLSCCISGGLTNTRKIPQRLLSHLFSCA